MKFLINARVCVCQKYSSLRHNSKINRARVMKFEDFVVLNNAHYY